MLNKICIVSAALPPQLDGIGDHTANLGAELSRFCAVTVLTNQGSQVFAIPGITIKQCFAKSHSCSFWRIAAFVNQENPDWILLQYNPFSYGRWGLNLHLPLVMRTIRRKGQTKVAVMVHEPFVPLTSWQFVVMSIWQRWQLWMLGKNADMLFFSIDPWVSRFQSWFPGQRVMHLPVGSNIPRIPLERAEAKTRLGIQSGTTVIGLFGSLNPSRMIEQVRETAKAAWLQYKNVKMLYIGQDIAVAKEAFLGVPLLAEGPLSPEEVSKRFSAMDIYLAPYSDGVSTRRTTLMTGLQHGLPVAGTYGELTDRILSERNGSALILVDVNDAAMFSTTVCQLCGDRAKQTSLSEEATSLFDREFSWQQIANRLLTALELNKTVTSVKPRP